MPIAAPSAIATDIPNVFAPRLAFPIPPIPVLVNPSVASETKRCVVLTHVGERVLPADDFYQKRNVCKVCYKLQQKVGRTRRAGSAVIAPVQIDSAPALSILQQDAVDDKISSRTAVNVADLREIHVYLRDMLQDIKEDLEEIKSHHGIVRPVAANPALRIPTLPVPIPVIPTTTVVATKIESVLPTFGLKQPDDDVRSSAAFANSANSGLVWRPTAFADPSAPPESFNP